MTDKSDDKVGHLNTILARGRGNLNDPIFKSSNAWGLLGRGMLKFRVDQRIKGKYHGVLVSFVKNDEIRPSISCQIILE